MQIKELKEKYPLVYETALKNQKIEDDNITIDGAFSWSATEEGTKFWSYINKENFDKAKETCPHLFEAETKKPLVFGLYNIGDIVVSLTDCNKHRYEGDLYKILRKSDEENLWYKDDIKSTSSEEWRAATPEEIKAYENGIRNINDIPKENKSLVGRYLKALVDKPQSTPFKKDDYVKILDIYSGNNQYTIENQWVYTTDNSTANQWELMPEGFNPDNIVPEPTVQEENQKDWIPKVGDWIVITRGFSNWIFNMDKYIGKVVQITEVLGTILSSEKVKFKGDDNYVWQYNNGHFRKALIHEIPKEETEKVDFIEGKWYKLKTSFNWYAKLLDFKNDTFVANEYIDLTNKMFVRQIGNWYGFTTNNYSVTLVTDLSEIQQYLPDGHPDKKDRYSTDGRWIKDNKDYYERTIELPKKKKNYEIQTNLVTTDFTFKKKPKKTILSI